MTKDKSYEALIDAKNHADRTWNYIFQDMLKGAKIGRDTLSQIMYNCNKADAELIKYETQKRSKENKEKFNLDEVFLHDFYRHFDL